MVVQEMLTAEGHTVSVASDGPEASEIVADSYKSGEPFDVVISDIEMPVLNVRMLADITALMAVVARNAAPVNTDGG
jgi:CheY-like chemotaxis protein